MKEWLMYVGTVFGILTTVAALLLAIALVCLVVSAKIHWLWLIPAGIGLSVVIGTFIWVADD